MPANRHINIFHPYEGTKDGHEDRLTRAALIVMRQVPLAQAAFLGLAADDIDLGALPRGEFDTQRKRLVNRDEPELAGSEEPEFEEILSVFLTPDESRPKSGESQLELAERGQIIDGLITYGEKLLVAIESKINRGQTDRQARYLSPEGATFARLRPVSYVPWHQLLERWWRLKEEGLLAPGEAVVVDDFFLMAEEDFAGLLPFTTLRRAGTNRARQQRRLRTVLEAATCLQASDDRDFSEVTLDTARSVKLARLSHDGDGLRLSIWPGELKAETWHLYEDRGRAIQLSSLADLSGFDIRPNGRLGFRYDHGGRDALGFAEDISIDQYLKLWSSPEGQRRNRAFSANELREELLPWLRDQGMMDTPTEVDLDSFLRNVGGESDRKSIYLRQGLWIGKLWEWDEAADLDDDGKLAGEVRTALNIMLSALGEDSVPNEDDESAASGTS